MPFGGALSTAGRPARRRLSERLRRRERRRRAEAGALSAGRRGRRQLQAARNWGPLSRAEWGEGRPSTLRGALLPWGDLLSRGPLLPRSLRAPGWRRNRLRHRNVYEQPFVVARPPVVDLDRCFFALRLDALNAERRLRPKRRARRSSRLTNGRGALSAWRRSAARRGNAPRRTATRDWNQLKVIVRHRIFVFLPEESLLDEKVDGGRIGVREFLLEQADRTGVLPPAKNQLFFTFPLRKLRPDGHRHRQHYSHDAQADKESGHGVATVSAEHWCGTGVAALT
jgi:hypothetical protein